MCQSETEVELCRSCHTAVIDESEAKVQHCHLWDHTDQDMHCLTLEKTTHSFISHSAICYSCSQDVDRDDNDANFQYSSSGDSSNDTSYSRRIGYANDSEDEDSDDD